MTHKADELEELLLNSNEEHHTQAAQQQQQQHQLQVQVITLQQSLSSL